jgi:hypothetical protein
MPVSIHLSERGSIMATTNAKRTAISADIFMPKLTLTLNFADGKELVIDAAALRPEIRDMAMMHGLKQKLVDAAALSRNPVNGQPASVADKYDAVKRVADRLMSADGTWNEGRGEGNSATSGSGNMLVRALMHMRGCSETFAKDFLSSKTKEQIAALKKNPRVMAAMAEVQAATVVNDVHTDALLWELGVDTDEEPAIEQPTEPVASKPAARSRKPKLVPAPTEA